MGWTATFVQRSAADVGRGAAVRMRFVGALEPKLTSRELLAGVENYFLGDDPELWRTGVPRFGSVCFDGMYDGVDVVGYGTGGHFEYDVVLAPHAALSAVEVRVEGAQSLRIDPDGALVMETAAGPVRQPRPTTWEVGPDGSRRPVVCDYELRDRDRFGFTAPAWSGATELVVDPGLLYSTFLGDTGQEAAEGIAVDARGIVTIAAASRSLQYPLKAGAFPWKGATEMVVTRLDPSKASAQQLLFSTFVGGAGDESVAALSVDSNGVTTVLGGTQSKDFPTTANAYDRSHNGDWDMAVLQLDPRLNGAQQLVYSTYLGGSGLEGASNAQAFGNWEGTGGLRVSDAGVITLTEFSWSFNFPTTPGAFRASPRNGNASVVICQLDPRLAGPNQLIYSTFVHDQNETSYDVHVDQNGWITVCGRTRDAGFPTTNGAYDTTFNGFGGKDNCYKGDAFVARLDPKSVGQAQLRSSTFIGGSHNDVARTVWVDDQGAVWIAGATSSRNFPTTSNAYNRAHNGGEFDAFVARFDPSLSVLLYSSYIGGSAMGNAPNRCYEVINDIAVDSAGVATVVGRTPGGWPTTPGAYDTTFNGGWDDAFLTRLDPSRPPAQQLIYSTYLGGKGADTVFGAHIDAFGVATVAGETVSSDFPTQNAFDPTFAASGSNGDIFVARIEMLPTGAQPYGNSSPGCNGPVAIGVTSIPQVGNASFAITCRGAPKNAQGFALLGTRTSSAVRIMGADAWVDIASALLVPRTSDQRGGSELPIPIPNNPAFVGVKGSAQFAWSGPSGPASCPPAGVSASNALEMTIQR